MESIMDLDSAFSEASETVKEFVNIDTTTMLRLYGLYKQATLGTCNISKPGIFNYTARQKWEAWNALGTTSLNDAKSQYIELVDSLASSHKKGTSSVKKTSAFGVTVSCMAKMDQELDDSDKTIFDWLKEGKIEHVSSMLSVNPSLIDQRDENEMALIHWAADRGDTSMINLLAKKGADVNVTDGDGQTPLHYAFACGHDECIRFLEELHANQNIRDHNGMLPSELSDL
jgi:acyl-CoA-binding protein